MKIAILGYGKEGKAAEKYFKKGNEIQIIDHFTPEELAQMDFSEYDLVLRSPSVPPRAGVSSATTYFFDHCPTPIIGVTGTKGKGTTCSMITALLEALGEKVYLLGNIGKPALDYLDKIKKNDVVVYEMSSFQLWDMKKSPHIAVVLRIEPDHLNVHKDFADYVNAKSHIAEFQTKNDSIIYFKDNPDSVKIAQKSVGTHIPYPLSTAESSPKVNHKSTKNTPSQVSPETDMSAETYAKVQSLLDTLTVPGQHNRENAEAALLAVAAYYDIPLEQLVAKHFEVLRTALHNFEGLPHHIEFVRTLHGVDYYDDSFSTNQASLEAALKSFPKQPLYLIAGGQDKKVDLTEIKRLIFSAPNLKKAILLGEIKKQLAKNEDTNKYLLVDSLEEAVAAAQKLAETERDSVVLLSPAAASLDMFESYYQRGDLFKEYVKNLD